MNSLFDCWGETLRIVGHLGARFWWIPTLYAGIYAVAAAIFLATLKFGSVGGTLQVSKRSLAFLIAHPTSRVWDHRFEKYQLGSICPFFARLFHMLILVWPFLGLYVVLGTIIGFTIVPLFVGNYLVVNFSEDGFFDSRSIYWGTHKLQPLLVYIAPVALVVGLIMAAPALWHFAKWLFIGATCTVPVWLPLLVGGIVAARIIMARQESSPTTFAVKEFVISTKEQFCKLVNFTS